MFEKIACVYAFYDSYYGDIFYNFETIPQIGHGEWAITRGGDSAYDLRTDQVTQTEFPDELLLLLDNIPSDIEIESWEG